MRAIDKAIKIMDGVPNLGSFLQSVKNAKSQNELDIILRRFDSIRTATYEERSKFMRAYADRQKELKR